tara:strand:- start:68 stop:421 length:354 start_codon:yes stop_codon:yes gene_type:complete
MKKPLIERFQKLAGIKNRPPRPTNLRPDASIMKHPKIKDIMATISNEVQTIGDAEQIVNNIISQDLPGMGNAGELALNAIKGERPNTPFQVGESRFYPILAILAWYFGMRLIGGAYS